MAEMIKLAGNNLDAYLAKPNANIKGAVIVIHEVWGLDDHIKSVADRLAMEGYIALAPELLADTLDLDSLRGMKVDLFDPDKRNQVQPMLRQHMTPMQNPEFAKQTIANLESCFDYLYDLPEAQSKVAVMGFCFGGTYSFNLAVDQPKLKAAIVFYGHADQSVDELKRINCPIQAFYGEQDESLVSNLDNLKQKMAEAKVNFKAKVYPNCGHAFFNDTNKFAYNQAAANDAWQITLASLDENLS